MTYRNWKQENAVSILIAKVAKIFSKNKIVDPKTGNIEGLKYDPNHTERDYYIPVR